MKLKQNHIDTGLRFISIPILYDTKTGKFVSFRQAKNKFFEFPLKPRIAQKIRHNIKTILDKRLIKENKKAGMLKPN